MPEKEHTGIVRVLADHVAKVTRQELDRQRVVGRALTAEVKGSIKMAVAYGMESAYTAFPFVLSEPPRVEVQNIKVGKNGMATYDMVPLNESARIILEAYEEHKEEGPLQVR